MPDRGGPSLFPLLEGRPDVVLQAWWGWLVQRDGVWCRKQCRWSWWQRLQAKVCDMLQGFGYWLTTLRGPGPGKLFYVPATDLTLEELDKLREWQESGSRMRCVLFSGRLTTLLDKEAKPDAD